LPGGRNFSCKTQKEKEKLAVPENIGNRISKYFLQTGLSGIQILLLSVPYYSA
jgi:hypothetical protein